MTDGTIPVGSDLSGDLKETAKPTARAAAPHRDSAQILVVPAVLLPWFPSSFSSIRYCLHNTTNEKGDDAAVLGAYCPRSKVRSRGTSRGEAGGNDDYLD